MSEPQRITFPGAHGDELAARLDLPRGEPAAFALFAHCFTCSKDVFAASRISRALTGHGIAVLRFDFTGLGSSDGEFANTTFSSNVQDIEAAATYLRDRHRAPSLLIGHSLGGAAVLAAAAEVPEAVAVATIGAPADPAHVTNLLPVDEIRREGEVEVELAGRRFTIRRSFLEDVSSQRLTEHVRGLRRPVIVFHAPRDQIVGIDNARVIYEAARHPKSFVSLDTADHLLTDRADADYVADVLAAWASRYLEVPGAPDPGERGVVVVAEASTGTYTQDVTAGPHRFMADEPPTVGDDRGPNPYDLLLAGLGACTSMTLRMYADRKDIPLDHVSVRLTHDRIHAEDCEGCETRSGRISSIRRVLTLRGDDLTDEHRTRLLEIADRCPVHRTLTDEKQIITRMDDE